MGHRLSSKASMAGVLTSTALALLIASPGAGSGSPAGGSEQMAGSDQVVAKLPRDLQWAGAPSLPGGATIAIVHGNPKGAEPLTIRLKFPAKYQVPPHSHPVTENVTVLSGSLHVGLGERLDKSKGQKLEKGGFVRVPAGMPHFAWTEEETIIQLHSNSGPWAISYVNPEDDPRSRAS